MRETTEKLNTEETIQNINVLLGIDLEEIPQYDSINDVFKNFNIDELRNIQKYMVNRLISSKMFDKYRYKNKRFQIVVDGTRMMKFKERHCKHCLWEVHNKGQENEYTRYYHYVLEAKLVVGEIVISIDSEFIENERFNIQKNGTFDIEHMYSQHYNAIKAHYFFIQFAHTIRQLLEKGLKYIVDLKMSIKEVSAVLTLALTQLTTSLIEYNKIQLRFEPKLGI